MPLVGRPQLDLDRARPTWLTAGMVRLAVLSAFVVLVGMVRARMSPHGGWIVVAGGSALVLAGAILFATSTRRLAERLRLGHATEAFLMLLRRTGLPLLGLAFFLAWTLVYIALWAFHPSEAFRGLEKAPRFADFFYYAVSTAFISPPGDVLAHSRGARSATMIEMLTAFALLTAYLSSFVDWYGRRGQES
ncbi:MAG TPA: hypothetical protein VF895_06320 [Gaiellaceae bacterium]